MRLIAAPDRHRRQPVGDEEHDQGAGGRLGDRPLPASERDAAEHGRGQHRHLEADTDVAANGAEPGCEEQRADRGQDAAGDVAKRDGPPDRDSGIIGRAARAADRGDVPARTQPRQEDVAEDRDREIEDGDAGHAEHIAAADEIPGREIRKGRRDLGRVGEQQEIVGGAVDDQRNQGRDEGPEPEIADQEPVHRAEQRAAEQRHHDTAGTGQSSTSRKYSAQKSHSANIEPTERSMPPTMTTSAIPSTTKPISPACRAVSASDDGEKKLSMARLERDRDDHQHDHGDRGFGPALGENFAKQMVGPVSGLQSNESFLHRRTMSLQLAVSAPARTPRLRPEPSSTIRYFFRSARFQQAVLLSAFSLVIGIRVV